MALSIIEKQTSDANRVEEIRTLLAEVQERAKAIEDAAIRDLLLSQSTVVLSAIKHLVDHRQPVAESSETDVPRLVSKDGRGTPSFPDNTDPTFERGRFEENRQRMSRYQPLAQRILLEQQQSPMFTNVAYSDLRQMNYLILKTVTMDFDPAKHEEGEKLVEERIHGMLPSLLPYATAKNQLRTPTPNPLQQARRDRFSKWAMRRNMTRGRCFDDIVLAVYHADLPLIHEAARQASERLQRPLDEVRQELEYCFARCCWTYDPHLGDFNQFVTANLEKALQDLEAHTEPHGPGNPVPCNNGSPLNGKQIETAELVAPVHEETAVPVAPVHTETTPTSAQLFPENVPVIASAPTEAPRSETIVGIPVEPAVVEIERASAAEPHVPEDYRADEKTAEPDPKEEHERAFKAWAKQDYGITGVTMGEICNALSDKFEPLAMGVAGKTIIGMAKTDRATLRRRAVQQLRAAVPHFDPHGKERFDTYLQNNIARELQRFVLHAERVEEAEDGKKKKRC